MEYKQPFDQLYDPHKKAQEAIDNAREVREKKVAEPGKKNVEKKATSADTTKPDAKD